MANNMTASQYARGRARLKQMALNIYDVVKLNEGFKTKAYKDTKGNMTIGVGFNLESPIIIIKLFKRCLTFIGLINIIKSVIPCIF